MSDRLTKKQLKADPFLDAVQTAVSYARENTAIVVAGAVVFLAAVVLAVKVGGSAAGGGGGGDPVAERALANARSEFVLGRMETGIQALDQVRTTHRGTQAAQEATYVLGSAYFESGDWARAETAFRDFLEKPLHDDLMLDGARLAIGACKEESGDLPGALAAYREVWDTGTHAGSRIQGALAAARCARGQGRADEARELYQAIMDRHPDSPEAESAEFELLAL